MKIKASDIIIILLVTGITFFSGYSAYMKHDGDAQVLIRGQGREWLFPVEASETIIVPGPLGDTIIKIDNNRAWVESSPCGNQTCAASGMLTRHGQWAACLPNNVLLMVRSDGGEDIDAHSW